MINTIAHDPQGGSSVPIATTNDRPRNDPHGGDDVGRLVVVGDDQPGIVATISTLLRERGANIVALDQYSTDPVAGRFYQRTEFSLPNLQAVRPELERELDEKVAA